MAQNVDLENTLRGENLVFYKNIQDLKVLTVKAKALINRSHTMYNDIIQGGELRILVRGNEPEEDLASYKSLSGECVKCGLQHGANDFCIVEEILAVEKKRRESSRKSLATVSQGKRGEGEEVPYSRLTASPKPLKGEPSTEKVKEWENLLYREFTPQELHDEYSKICYRYGVSTGRNFLLARSFVRKRGEIEPFCPDENRRITHWDQSKIASIAGECLLQEKSGAPGNCPNFSQEVQRKMAEVIDLELPCNVESPKQGKPWKNALKGKAVETIFDNQEPIEDDYYSSSSSDDSRSELCDCGFKDCDCNVQPSCNPPEKRCQTPTGFRNNYLYTIREKMRQRRLLKGKLPPSSHRVRQSSSQEVSRDELTKDSELMMEKSLELQKKQLKNCLASAIGKYDPHLDKNVSKIAKITSVFTKPSDKAWDRWTDGFRAQKEKEDDEGVSGDSDIATTPGSSVTSSTDRELYIPRPPVKRIPCTEESLKLADILFDKIYARFTDSFRKNVTRPLAIPYKRLFFSHMDQLTTSKCTSSIGEDAVLGKLNLPYSHVKRAIPKKPLKALRLKRLTGKKKQLSKKLKRRRYIEGIQVGKRYRRPKKSMNFTKDRGYVGFSVSDRELLQKATPERFAASDLVGDDSGVLLSKERIQYHYRLLRTLFNGMESDDKDSLMDEGMRERLQKFKKTLHKGSMRGLEADSDTGDEDASTLKVSSVPVRRPSKMDEKKLKSASGCFPGSGTRNDHKPRTLSGQFNYGGGRSLYEGLHPRTTKTSSDKSTRIASHRGAQSRTQTCPGTSLNSPSQFGGFSNAPSLEESFCKTSKDSLERSSSKKMTRSSLVGAPTTFSKVFAASKQHSNSQSFPQWEQLCLPTPPLSESSSDEIDFDTVRHRFPRKEEAHMEKSARIDAATIGEHTKELEDSEFTDGSSGSYVPKLLKIPAKRTFINTGALSSSAQDQSRAAYHKAVRTRARSTYLFDSSSTDTEPASRNRHRERAAWDRKTGMVRKIPPYVDTRKCAKQRDGAPNPGLSYESGRTCESKTAFTSLLPKAGRSILKNSSLPKPPSDGPSENHSKTHSLGMSRVKRESFSDSSYRTTRASEGLIKPARVVTERLLKATQGNPQDPPGGSSKKYSAQSRATPESVASPSISGGGSKKSSVGPPLGLSKSGQLETEDGDYSPITPRQRQSVMIKQPKASTSHRTGDKSTEDVTGHESNQLQLSGSLTASSSKRLSRRPSSKVVSEVFRRRSLAPESAKKELTKMAKGLKQDGADEGSLQNASLSSTAAKLKKLEAVGPTKRRCFNMDIGQGINCVNYLKENAPGADETKKRELVDLLVTPIEIKKPAKKAVAKVEIETSLESAAVKSQQSALESSSSSLLSANRSAKNSKVQSSLVRDQIMLRRTNFKTLDQIYKEVHGINKNNTPQKFLDRDYEHEEKIKQQLTKHKIFVD